MSAPAKRLQPMAQIPVCTVAQWYWVASSRLNGRRPLNFNGHPLSAATAVAYLHSIARHRDGLIARLAVRQLIRSGTERP